MTGVTRSLRPWAIAVVLSAACAARPPAAPPRADPTPPGAIAQLAQSPEPSAEPALEPPAALPTASGPLGTAHPTLLVSADPEARWVAICQARNDTDRDGKIEVGVGYHGETYGDELAPYLVIGDGPGSELDDFVTASRDGRRIVVVEKKRLIVIDVTTAERLDLSALGADASDDPRPFGPHRAASFDARGEKLLYVRRKAGRHVIVVRELDTGNETVVDPGKGLLWRADLSEDGTWVQAWVVAKDGDKNGKLELPSMHTSLSARRCRGPITSYSTGGMRGDPPERRLAPASGGTARDRGDVVGNLGDGLVVRGNSGELELVRAKKRVSVAPSGCDAKLLHTDAARGKILIGCNDGGRADSYALLFGPNGSKRLELRTLHASRQFDVRWVGVNGYASDAFLDLASDRVHPLGQHEWVRASDGPRAIVSFWDGKDSREVRWVDVERGKRRTLIALGKHHGQAAAVAGPMIAIANKVFDARTGRELGRYDREPLAIDLRGRLLQPATDRRHSVAPGPLTWKPPSR